MCPVRLSDVFTPGGLPSVTYVSRDHLELETKIEDALARGFSFIVVTGPTKSGKTVLCKRVLKNQKVVTVEGGRIRSEADFWLHIAASVNLPVEKTLTSTEALTTAFNGEGSGGIPGIFSAKAGTTRSDSEQTATANKFAVVPVIAAIERLVADRIPLLVDDFHYIDPEVQKAIIQSLKSAVFEGLPVLLLAVPHRAFDPLTVEREVEGRFKHIPIPAWSLEDLVQIPAKGFPELNARVERKVQTRICEDSFGNPLLVQDICSEFCLKNKVREKAAKPRKLNPKLLETTYIEMADSKGFPSLEILTRTPNARARALRKMRGGGEEDINKALLTSIARLGPKNTSNLSDIRLSYEAILDPSLPKPRKAEVVKALEQISSAAKANGQGQPSLEWIPEKEQLVITDPFLQFYLKWHLRKR